ncbi:MAG: hypothetical protein CBC55_08145 [Gammaproteobacteria bacterium TMED95]|nr:MAG: hypothetical protein CBC55_08145 [Gammaproteobacteria bacterium TMED95]
MFQSGIASALPGQGEGQGQGTEASGRRHSPSKWAWQSGKCTNRGLEAALSPKVLGPERSRE